MKYQSGVAFRQALEARLLARSKEEGIPLSWLRKMVAFDRLLARLVADAPEKWILKGGLALQLRLGITARTTKDIDVMFVATIHDIHELLVNAALIDLDDWFRFMVSPVSRPAKPEEISRRFQVSALVGGRPFEQFHIDVGLEEPIIDVPESFTMPSFLAFAEIEPATILCYPISQQIADKIHAYTRPRPSGMGSRVKDVIDILLIARSQSFRRNTLHRALQTTFAFYDTHPMPENLPEPPSSWAAPYRNLVKNTGLPYPTPSEAVAAMRSFIEPALQCSDDACWHPHAWSWEKSVEIA
jgi:predicted nucleotidyltransferase component of viral defense system